MAKDGDPEVSGGAEYRPDAAAHVERKAARKAARQAAKAEAELRKARKAESRSERKAAKKAEKSIRAAEETAKRAAKDAQKAARKAARKASKGGASVQEPGLPVHGAAEQADARDAEADVPGESAGRATMAAAAAGAALAEVAGLVRQATGPAAAWIAGRVRPAEEERQSDAAPADAGESVAAAPQEADDELGAEDEPGVEDEPVAEDEPGDGDTSGDQDELEPEGAPETEAGPEAADAPAVPGPEPEAQAQPDAGAEPEADVQPGADLEPAAGLDQPAEVEPAPDPDHEALLSDPDTDAPRADEPAPPGDVSAPDIQTVPFADPWAEPPPVTNPEPESDTSADAAPGSASDPHPATDPEPAPGTWPDPEPDPAGDGEPPREIDFVPSPVPFVGAPAQAAGDHDWPTEDRAPSDAAPPVAAPASEEPAPGPQEPAPTAAASPAIAAEPGTVIGATVDIGANSAHLLVAAVAGHRLEPLLDESAFLGLGDRVARDGYLGEAARAELVETLAGYADAARRLGAGSITLIGTEPLRRAADAAALVHEVLARAGVPLHVVDHDEEAMLMLLGVTGGRAVTSELLVIDIGGGSTEFVITGPGEPVRATGLRLGGARVTQDHARSDPPTLAEIDAMRAAVRATVVDAPVVQPAEIIAVGGTASNLLKLLPATAVDRLLTRRRITVALAMLTVERSAEAAERHLLRPERARVLPAGALIVDAILEHYGADRLRVSDEGIREGTILAAVAGGPAWRDLLPTLVAGWGEADGPTSA